MVYWRISLLRCFNCDYYNILNGDYTQVGGFPVREALSGGSGVQTLDGMENPNKGCT